MRLCHSAPDLLFAERKNAVIAKPVRRLIVAIPSEFPPTVRAEIAIVSTLARSESGDAGPYNGCPNIIQKMRHSENCGA